MINYQSKVTNFINKVVTILDIGKINDDEGKIVGNLVSIFVLNLSALLGEKTVFKDIVAKFSDKNVNVINYLGENDIDCVAEFDQSINKTLTDFVDNMKNSFDEGQIEEINRVI